MTDGLSVYALGLDQLGNSGLLVIKFLATAGGAGLGTLATGWLVRGLCRLLLHRPASPGVLWVRWLGAAAGGLAVWVWVSGPGGGGWGGGGPGGGSGDGGGNGTAVSSQAEKKNETTPQGEVPEGTPRIVIVRSKDYERGSLRYYLVDGKPPPLTLDKVVEFLKQRQQENPSLRTVEVVIYQDSAAEVLGFVSDLKERLGQLGIKVHTSKPPTNAP